MFKAKKSITFCVIVALVLVLAGCTDSKGDRYISFGKCLKDKGAVMYGAYWCPHCTKQKKLFGENGFAQVNYTECDARGPNGNPALCKEKGIKSYPTWIFADGTQKSGEIPLEELAQKTSCELPTDYSTPTPTATTPPTTPT